MGGSGAKKTQGARITYVNPRTGQATGRILLNRSIPPVYWASGASTPSASRNKALRNAYNSAKGKKK